MPYSQLKSAVDTNGYFTSTGVLLNAAAGSAGGVSFTVNTYPGLQALADRAFGSFRALADTFAPDLDKYLANGAGGIADWWTAFKAEVSQGNPQLAGVLNQIDFVGEYESNTAVPDKDIIPFIPFRFNVFAAATTMTQGEFVTYMTDQALQLRANIIASAGTANPAPSSLLALVADPTRFVNLELAALEQAGILLPADGVAPITQQQDIQSLLSVLASGILYGPSGTAIRSTGNLLDFFDALRTLYGDDPTKLAPLSGTDPRQDEAYSYAIPIPALPTLSEYDQHLSTATSFEAFNIYVPWVPFEDRGAGLPADFQINGPAPAGADPFAALNFDSYFDNAGAAATIASIAGPQTYDTAGFLPAATALPYTVNFDNPSAATATVNQITIVTQLDPSLDPYTFQLGAIKIGDITIDVPAGQSTFTQDIDFSATRGFILRVAAGIDLTQARPSAKWVIQAIDPLTGEVLTDSTRGLLPPNDSQDDGAGYVSYTAQLKSGVATGTRVSANASVTFDTLAPQVTATLTQVADTVAPTTTLAVSQIGTSSSYAVHYSVADDAGGSGFQHVTLYVSMDGGNYTIWQSQLTTAAGTLVYQGTAGHTYQFLGLATDNAGNQEQPADTTLAVPGDGTTTNLGTTPQVAGTTAPDFGIAPTPVTAPSSNPLFTAAQQDIPSATPASLPAAFSTVLAPFNASVFAAGIPQSEAGIGPQAIVELPSGGFLISGGANRGTLYAVPSAGSAQATPLITLPYPIGNMAFDKNGALWATTAGGPLVQLDPLTGAILASYGTGITLALAVDPASGTIYVSTNDGVSTFDPVTHAFTQFSVDQNLRVNSLAVDNAGNLWATTWPDRRQVVEFDAHHRAVTKLGFDSDIDSLAFGQAGTALAGLLFVSHNDGPVDATGAPTAASELTMVDVATLQEVAVAAGGSRGGVVITTSDGRVLLSQTDRGGRDQPGLRAGRGRHQPAERLPGAAAAAIHRGDVRRGHARGRHADGQRVQPGQLHADGRRHGQPRAHGHRVRRGGPPCAADLRRAARRTATR